jgi:voltage-gated potassium channel
VRSLLTPALLLCGYYLLPVQAASALVEGLWLWTRRALYFTVTVFPTVGFGDITPTSDATRLLVTGRMLLNLVVLGATARLLFDAAKRGASMRPERRSPADDGRSP